MNPSEPVSETRATQGRVRRKRVVTAARKEQNRAAQKAYRQRRKESCQRAAQEAQGAKDAHHTRELRPYLGTTLIYPPKSNTNWETLPSHPAVPQPPRPYMVSLDGEYGICDTGLPSASMSPHLGDNASSSDTVFHRLFRDSTYTFPTGSTSNNWTLDFPSAASPSTSPDTNNAAGVVDTPQTLADPITNSIQFKPVTLFSAMMSNALSLGFDVAKLLTADYVSPFYRPVTPQDDPKALLATVSQPSFPAHLQPTLPQILYPHHPYLDLLPYPHLRARLIVFSALMPHTIDQLDFKRDIYVNSGLVCWKTNGYAQPWDMRNWEAAHWFLNKWKMLVDGENGEIWKQSRWWWGLRERVVGAFRGPEPAETTSN
ncbi:hypothetical protein F5Y19DRAFT_412152 [Xylariaceae sp. FL1651]|nr:hypothetical protein F5Y19DRAFT_412152 [Xylariaceae sp. FL1651]